MRHLRRPRTASPRAGFQWGLIGALVVLAGGAAWLCVRPGGWLAPEVERLVAGAPVRRGPLRISVLERGNLRAADAVSLKSEIEGQTSILWLIAEGSHVQPGDLLCELDATQLEDKRIQQDIAVRNAKAAWVKSQQTLRIQESQNASDIAAAEQKLQFAKDDLVKLRETMQFDLAKAQEAITLAEETQTRDANKLDWSRKLAESGFLTATELEADTLAANRAQILLEQSRREMNLLEAYELPRKEDELEAALAEAERELERVKLQAAARLVDFEADMQTNEARHDLESEKLTKLVDQIAKARIVAPRAGMVVYGQEEGGRMGNREPIAEGTMVRERQEILSIPNTGGMVAQASLHEAVLKQIQVGQSALVRIDSIPGRDFRGRVHYVALMADQGSWWANPNLRVYRTDVQIVEPVEGMRPGMSCAVEILVEEIPDTLYVPVQSVFRSGEETLCYVAQPNGATEPRGIEIGKYNEKWVQVLSGLSEGEEVLLSLPAGVTLQPPKAAEGEIEATTVPGEGAPPTAAAPQFPVPGEAVERDGARPAGDGARERGGEAREGGPDAGAQNGEGRGRRGFSPEMLERIKDMEGMTPEILESMRNGEPPPPEIRDKLRELMGNRGGRGGGGPGGGERRE
jgi:HlyD family secretion protein